MGDANTQNQSFIAWILVLTIPGVLLVYYIGGFIYMLYISIREEALRCSVECSHWYLVPFVWPLSPYIWAHEKRKLRRMEDVEMRMQDLEVGFEPALEDETFIVHVGANNTSAKNLPRHGNRWMT